MTNDLTNYYSPPRLTEDFVDDDNYDVTAQPLKPFRRRVAKAPKAPTFCMAIGDSQRLVQPGELVVYRALLQRTFQLLRIELTQYPTGSAGEPCWWPIEYCYVGDLAIGGPQGLHTGAVEPITCHLGQQIELVVRNPLSVPAAMLGCLVGRAVKRSLAPLNTAELERLSAPTAALRCNPYHADGIFKTCPRCGEQRCPRCCDARGYCKLCDSTTPDAVVCAPENHQPVPRDIVYCEHAPPRDVVERVMVRCGTGLEGGKPVMAPLVYTWAMRQTWDRHEAYQTRGGALAMDASSREVTPPSVPDAYGGSVLCVAGDREHPLLTRRGYRCRLCGGWIREVTL